MKKYKYLFLLIPLTAFLLIYLFLVKNDLELPGSEDEYIYDNGFVLLILQNQLNMLELKLVRTAIK